MPFIHVTHTTPASHDSEMAVAQGITALMHTVLRKKAELTSVLVERVPAPTWTIGGTRPPGTAHVEANITAGTNTETEKATFIREAMALLGAELGTLPQATYVILREIPATDWGYDGETQKARQEAAT